MSFKFSTDTDGWDFALKLVKKYTLIPTKIDTLLSCLPEILSSKNRSLCQFLFFGVIRHKLLIETILKPLINRNTPAEMLAVLKLATFEILQKSDSDYPKIVDFAVNKTKKHFSTPQARFVNAVLRKVKGKIEKLNISKNLENPEHLSIFYSHPLWLVNRWIQQFGLENSTTLLEWNQFPAPVYTRIPENITFEGLKPTPWDHFYKVEGPLPAELKELISQGKAYIQDPSTCIGPEFLDGRPSETVLDLCAAPGGKSSFFAQKLSGSKGKLVAVDLPGPRLKVLEENLSKFKDLNYSIIASDLLKITPELFTQNNCPAQYDAIYLDVPCSNTGVLRRRPDAKWRLEEDDIKKMSSIQFELLAKASSFLTLGGRLVYSTCSIEDEENQHVIRKFLNNNKSFSLEKEHLNTPWSNNCDGGSAFLLRRNS